MDAGPGLGWQCVNNNCHPAGKDWVRLQVAQPAQVNHIQCGCGQSLKDFNEVCPKCGRDHGYYNQLMATSSQHERIRIAAKDLAQACEDSGFESDVRTDQHVITVALRKLREVLP